MNARVRRLFHQMRTEYSSGRRDAAAVAVGTFIGCLPLYGLHLLLSLVAGRVLGLNRLKVYLAANISNPLVAPLLLFIEVQAGAWVRRGSPHAITLDTVRTTPLSVFGLDVVVGSLVVGASLGIGLGLATYALTQSSRTDEPFLSLVGRAADRYIVCSVMAWEFARGKLRHDPLYRAVLTGSFLPSGGTLLDVGCGTGLMLALLAEARAAQERGDWRAPIVPASFDQMVGVELRPHAGRIAREALGPDASIVLADVRRVGLPPSRAVLLFDVLHMMPPEDQSSLIAVIARSLEPGGVILVREADPRGGLGFLAVRIGNRLKALAFGHWRQTFHFQTPDGWLAAFARHGLVGDTRPMHEGTPFANVLLQIRAPADAPAPTRA